MPADDIQYDAPAEDDATDFAAPDAVELIDSDWDRFDIEDAIRF